MRLHLKRKTVLAILLPIVTGVGGWMIMEVFAESQGMNRAFFYFVVTGNGEGEMAGYFGWINDPEPGLLLYSHTYARVSSSVGIENIMLQANESGYETVLVANPPDYDGFPPRVVVRNSVTLYPNNVPVNFTIVVLEDGYLSVNVHSDYYLRDGWMRSVFSRMLQDINLSPSILLEFELAVNHIARGF